MTRFSCNALHGPNELAKLALERAPLCCSPSDEASVTSGIPASPPWSREELLARRVDVESRVRAVAPGLEGEPL